MTPNPISNTAFQLQLFFNDSNAREFIVDNTGQQNLTFFFGPRTSIGELSSTFYAEFRYAYRIFVSKIQRTLFVQNNTLRTNEADRNLP